MNHIHTENALNPFQNRNHIYKHRKRVFRPAQHTSYKTSQNGAQKEKQYTDHFENGITDI